MRCYICGRASMTMLDSNVWYIKPKTHRWWFFPSRKNSFIVNSPLSTSFFILLENVELLFFAHHTFFSQYTHTDTYLDTYIHTYNSSLQSINSQYYHSTDYEHLNSTLYRNSSTFSFFFFRCLRMIAHFVWKWFTSDFRKSP